MNKKVLGILFGLNILALSVVWNLNYEGLEVIFFDVGQGDSILIQTSDNYQVLIDGGPDSTVIEKLGKRMPFYDREIEFLVLTHPDNDHIAGLIEVLKRYKVENILWTGVIKDKAEFREWQKLIKEESANIYIASANQKYYRGDISITVLYPFESLKGEEVKDANNSSIVLRFDFGDNCILFAGDIYQSVEKQLINNSALDCDILKVAHHGSKSSSKEDFIKAVSPQIAIISAGKDNYYGHPHQETLDVLKKYGINIFRTDLEGDVTINLR